MLWDLTEPNEVSFDFRVHFLELRSEGVSRRRDYDILQTDRLPDMAHSFSFGISFPNQASVY